MKRICFFVYVSLFCICINTVYGMDEVSRTRARWQGPFAHIKVSEESDQPLHSKKYIMISAAVLSSCIACYASHLCMKKPPLQKNVFINDTKENVEVRIAGTSLVTCLAPGELFELPKNYGCSLYMLHLVVDGAKAYTFKIDYYEPKYNTHYLNLRVYTPWTAWVGGNKIAYSSEWVPKLDAYA